MTAWHLVPPLIAVGRTSAAMAGPKMTIAFNEYQSIERVEWADMID
jgi:hypothetical protein